MSPAQIARADRDRPRTGFGLSFHTEQSTPSWTETDSTSPSYIENKPVLGTASRLDTGTNDGQLPSSPMPMSVMPTARAVINLIKLNIDSAAYRDTSYFTGYTDTQISAATTLGASSLATEASTRASADTSLTASLASEATTRASADTSNATAITNEATSRISGDATNSAAITTETTARQAAITSEASTRVSADTTNATAISTETTARQSAITSEAASRVTGDATNATAISVEVTNRTTAVSSEATSRASADSSEATTRGNADAALTASITALTPNKTSATLDFGFPSGQEGDVCTSTISASWVTANSRMLCLPATTDSSDHSTEETLLEQIIFTAKNILVGTSFDVEAYAPNGTWGRHNCLVVAI